MGLLSKIEIIIEGKPLKSFQQVTVIQSLYGIDHFEITCPYDNMESGDDFIIERSKDYLGLPVVIQTKMDVKGEEKDGIQFQGYVTEIQGSRSGMSDLDQVVISGGSFEISMNRKPTNRAFIDKTLEDIVKEVLKSYPVKSKISPRNKLKYPYIVQFEESDLEFLKRLSIRYGEWFFFNGKEMIFGEIPVVEETLSVGYNLQELSYELRVSPVKFNLYTLDPLKLEVFTYSSGNSKIESSLNSYGKHALKMSRKLYSQEGKDYFEHVNVDEKDYKKGLESVGETVETTDAVNLTDITGTSTNGLLNAGMVAAISGKKRDGKTRVDYGKHLITSVRHTFDRLLTYQNSFKAIPAEITMPENTDPYFVRSTGNQLGMVADNQDPKKLGRVKVSFWWMADSKVMTPWVKVLTPYTVGKGGVYLVPPLNTRVLVGFEDEDVEKPYVLGSLFDEDACPNPDWPGNYNDYNAKVHAIKTRSGQTIELWDDAGGEKIRIYDDGNKNEITLDSANGNITIRTSGTMTLEGNNIEIKAQGGIKMEAGQALEQKGMEVKTEAQTTLEAKATNVEIKANASLKAEGSATAEISSSGMMTVKGSMVMIN